MMTDREIRRQLAEIFRRGADGLEEHEGPFEKAMYEVFIPLFVDFSQEHGLSLGQMIIDGNPSEILLKRAAKLQDIMNDPHRVPEPKN
jgi:hypothetical protein